MIRCSPGEMLSIVKCPSTSVIVLRPAPSMSTTAFANGPLCTLSITKPWSFANPAAGELAGGGAPCAPAAPGADSTKASRAVIQGPSVRAALGWGA